MKRALSRVVLASGMLLGMAAVFPSFAADAAAGPVKPDFAKGQQLFEQGDAARGIVPCVSCHGPGGNSTIPANPNLAGQAHEYIYKQLNDFRQKEGASGAARKGPDGAPSVMSAMVISLTDADMRNVAGYISQQKLTAPRPPPMKSSQRLARRSGVPGCPSAMCQRAPVATRPTAPASPRNIRALADNSPRTLKIS